MVGVSHRPSLTGAFPLAFLLAGSNMKEFTGSDVKAFTGSNMKAFTGSSMKAFIGGNMKAFATPCANRTLIDPKNSPCNHLESGLFWPLTAVTLRCLSLSVCSRCCIRKNSAMVGVPHRLLLFTHSCHALR